MPWTLILLRGSKRPTACLFSGVLVIWVLGKFAVALPPVAPAVAHYQNVVQAVGFLAAAACWALFVWHLVAWERGARRSCKYCDGPLGGLRAGRVQYGRQLGDFRYCYACSRATPDPE